MAVKIEDMDMPKTCAACDLSYVDADTSELICPYNDCPASYTDRLKCCPLQPIDEIKGTISTEDYMKFYEQAEELCNRNPGIKDFEDFNKALRENK